MLDRRAFLRHASLTALGVLAAPFAAPRVSLAAGATDARLVFVLLRGGLDGLHALPPHGDVHFRRLRPTLGRIGDEVIDLDGYFGLHPALRELEPLYRQGELLLLPASSTRYRRRSHFDGQNVLENGSGRPFGAADGWLNRALGGLRAEDRRLGLAIGPAVPLILQGTAGVQAWDESGMPEVDEAFLRRLARAYADDPLFNEALMAARDAPDVTLSSAQASGGRLRGEVFERSAQAAAELLSLAHGPRVAVIDLDGWDTHFDQARRLDRLLGELGSGLRALHAGLGAHWAQTTVVLVSEFGRTASENGNRGTDHGTGGLTMLLGGRVRGGRIAGAWPGLRSSALHEGRDLAAPNSQEALFKAALIEGVGLSPGYVENVVFPDSRSQAPMVDLFRSWA